VLTGSLNKTQEIEEKEVMMKDEVTEEVNKRLLGAFAKLRKVTIFFVMSACLSVFLSVCLSVCPSVHPSIRQHGKTGLLLEGLSRNFTSIFEYFSKVCHDNSYFIKI
jgi:hypothetical protein